MVRTNLFPVVLVLLGGIRAVSAAPSDACSAQAPLHAAFRIETAANGPVMGIWYPTTDAESSYQYLAGAAGSVAFDGAPACGRFPLVVFSHGYGGCGVQSVFFTEQLARQGYVVAAPDHKDAGCSVNGSGSLNLVPPEQSFFAPETWTDATYADRRADIETVIDWMTGGSKISASVDASRIGGAGHSLGGYTILGVAGAWSTWRDPRIKAALLFSPYANPFLYDNRLWNVAVPAMYQGATGDVFITPFLQGSTGAFGLANSPKFFAELEGGSHFTWTNLTCGSQSVSACLETDAKAQLINSYAFAFLDANLKGNSASLSALSGSGLAQWNHATPLFSLPAAYAPANTPVSPDSIVSSYGTSLAVGTASTLTPDLPTTLANATVTVLDSAGHRQTAPLYFVSPRQINFVSPHVTADGQAQITVYDQGTIVASGLVAMQPVSPSLFAVGGGSLAAAQVLHKSAGTRTYSLTFDPHTGAAAPIDLGTPGDVTDLILYGTGMRAASSVTATIGSTQVPAVGPFVQSVYAGMDQVNVGPLPHSLAGSGTVDVVLTLDGKSTPPVTIAIQ